MTFKTKNVLDAVLFITSVLLCVIGAMAIISGVPLGFAGIAAGAVCLYIENKLCCYKTTEELQREHASCKGDVEFLKAEVQELEALLSGKEEVEKFPNTAELLEEKQQDLESQLHHMRQLEEELSKRNATPLQLEAV